MDRGAKARAPMKPARSTWICGAALAAAALAGAAGCSDEGGTSSSTTTTSTTTSTSSSSGGAGGEGGGGGAGGEGACLDPSLFADLFTIEGSDRCAVAVYDAAVDLGGYMAPTWGRHGGPLTANPGAGGNVDVTRWDVPAGATGALTPKKETVSVGVPMGAFLGAQAIDLPFFDWTAVSWTGAFPSTEGEVVLAEGAAIKERYDVQSFFSGAAVSDGASQGRLLYTGLSPIEDPMASKNALYAADSCGTKGAGARLLPEGDPACGPPFEVAAWGDGSGPVAADSDGNVFVVMSDFVGGDQEARGFAAAKVSRGAPATPGDTLFTLPGFGMSLAALAPADTAPGVLAFQPSDAMTGGLDVIGQRYSAAGGAITAGGAPEPLLKLAKLGTSIVLMTDDQGRLWAGGPGASGTRFVVLDRTPAAMP